MEAESVNRTPCSGRRSGIRHRRERGSALVEFTLVILPIMALMLMTMDIAWIFFAWASIQEGCREGVRFAVTGQLLSGYSGQDASIRAIIEECSFGFVNANNASSAVTIQYYSPLTLQPLNGAGSNAGGNVITITVSNISVGTFGPIFRRWAPVVLAASSSDVMEGSPNSTPPPR